MHIIQPDLQGLYSGLLITRETHLGSIETRSLPYVGRDFEIKGWATAMLIMLDLINGIRRGEMECDVNERNV